MMKLNVILVLLCGLVIGTQGYALVGTEALKSTEAKALSTGATDQERLATTRPIADSCNFGGECS